MQTLDNLLREIDEYQLNLAEVNSQNCLKTDFLYHYARDKFKSFLECFEEYLKDEKVQKEIFRILKKQAKYNIKSYYHVIPDLKYSQQLIMNLQKYDFYREVNNIDFQKLEKIIKDNIYINNMRYCDCPSDINIVSWICLNILYCDYIKEKEQNNILTKNNSTRDKLLEIYKDIDIDLNKKNNFNKHSLKSIDDNTKIVYDTKNKYTTPYIADKRFDSKYRFIIFDKILLTSCLHELFTKGKIKELSFKIYHILDEDNNISILDEKLYGTKLNLNIEKLPSISEFYNIKNTGDTFWIFHDNQKQQISFEELCDDSELFNGDVVTQLVHLEYEKINNEYFITHIDHEYIIYTFNEYKKRLKDNSQKGYKKVKTFKVDNAEIPFFYQYEHEYDGEKIKDYFLFIVLDSFFQHKELLQEYFAGIKDE